MDPVSWLIGCTCYYSIVHKNYIWNKTLTAAAIPRSTEKKSQRIANFSPSCMAHRSEGRSTKPYSPLSASRQLPFFSFLPRLPRKFHPDFRPLGWKSKLPRKSGKRTTGTIRPYGSQCGESKVQWVQSNESMSKGGVPQSNKCGWDMEASSFSNLWWNVWFRAGFQGKYLTWLKWFLVLSDVMI